MKNGKFRKYQIRIIGLDMFVYQEQEKEDYEFMHVLKGIHVKLKDNAKVDKRVLYPVKLIVSRLRARIFFFESQRIHR